MGNDNNLTRDDWTPKWGECANGFLANKDIEEEAKKTLKEETIKIMKSCGNPQHQKNGSTGLVFGYIQAGKTMSYAALLALAKDNHFQILIVVAGTTNTLLNQTDERLKEDLSIANGEGWKVFMNPKGATKAEIFQQIKTNSDPNAPSEFKRSILITVLKNTVHLENLAKIFETINIVAPIIIIDDEADQASMNTKAASNRRNDEYDQSAIYSHLTKLKSNLPNHTYLQYTATPQAPLFINSMDALSPDFINLITPGKDYVGGKIFFIDKLNDLVSVIPNSDIETKERKLTSIPGSLSEAMMYYFVGAACLSIEQKDGTHWSMIVHPAIKTSQHAQYITWIKNLKGHWEKILSRQKADEKRIELIEEFKSIHLKINTKTKFAKVLGYLQYVIGDTNVVEFNASDAGEPIDWKIATKYNILVGGFKLDRGFTVEGLTVTYMPRNKGGGNADSIEQRARFFGYKSKYLVFCRVYLDEDMKEAFKEYVMHEESMKRAIIDWIDSKEPIAHITKFLILNRCLNLTRPNILTERIQRSIIGTALKGLNKPHHSETDIKNNLKVYDDFYNKYKNKFKEDEGHDNRTEEQIHYTIKIDAQNIYDEFYDKLRFLNKEDSFLYNSFGALLELNKTKKVEVFLMKKGGDRSRSLDNDTGLIKNLFQGKNPNSGETIYPGDREIKSEKNITLQIHNIKIKDKNKKVITLAMSVPDNLMQDFISKTDYL